MKPDGFLKNSVFRLIIIGIILTGVLILVPTGYEDALIYKDAERVKAEILSVDNTSIRSSRLIQSGEQKCEILVKSGLFKGKEIEGVNFLTGSLEEDKIFDVGDVCLATISHSSEEISSCILTDHYRLDKEIILLGLFFSCLLYLPEKTDF